MSLLSSNGVSIESISIKCLHNKAISILKEMCKSPIKNEMFIVHFMVLTSSYDREKRFLLRTMACHLPYQIQENPELTEENIRIMKEYLYNRFVDTGIPLKDLNAMSDPIKEKDYIL